MHIPSSSPISGSEEVGKPHEDDALWVVIVDSKIAKELGGDRTRRDDTCASSHPGDLKKELGENGTRRGDTYESRGREELLEGIAQEGLMCGETCDGCS